MYDQNTPSSWLLVRLEDVVATDLPWEALFLVLKQSPQVLFILPWWLLHGRAFTAARIIDRVTLDIEYLPYNKDVLNFVRKEHESGRRPVLVTPLPEGYGRQVADHLGLFSRVVTGEEFPAYLESAQQDRSERCPRPEKAVFEHRTGTGTWKKKLYSFIQAVRLHQWLKNILVFVPLVTAHRINDPALVADALLGFLAFSLCASGVYLLNDLLDIPVDRRHPRKCNRPLAAAAFSVKWSSVLVIFLTLAAFCLGFVVSLQFFYVLAGYLVTTVAYSIWLKKGVIIDVIILAFLYTIRILAGGAAVSIVPSFWLLSFSMFVFFSLALTKRYSELLEVQARQRHDVGGRGYSVVDMDVVRIFGIASGYMSVLVLALYIHSKDVRMLYSHPQMIWLLCPIFLYWISRMWLITGRGLMHDDPLLFTLQDHVSQGIAAIGFLVLWLAV